MALLHHHLHKSRMVELDLFTAPLSQLSLEEKIYTEVLPLLALTDRRPIEFFIPRCGEKYMDLNET